MIKGYIFDFGGTLDTGGRHWGKVLWHAYMHNNAGISEQQFRDAYVHAERKLGSQPIITAGHTFRQTLDIKIGIELEYLAAEGCLAERSDTDKRRLHDGILSYVYGGVARQTGYSLKTLEELAHDYPLAVVSNFYGNLGTVLHEFGFDKVFTAVIESAAVGIRKPDPRIFTLGVEALGTEAGETAVVGDSFTNDIIPAKKAGCKAVWLKGEGWTDSQQDESLPDAIVTDLSQLRLKTRQL